jgi:hypothetical protein
VPVRGRPAGGAAAARGADAALREAAAIFAGCGAAYLEAQALAEWARAAAGLGDLPAARKAWRGVGRLWDAAGLPIQDRIFSRPF